jgi:hypothetical protein
MYREIVGDRNFHPGANFNFQLNRWLPFLSEDEVRQAATEISDFEEWSDREQRNYVRVMNRRHGHSAAHLVSLFDYVISPTQCH